MMVATGSYKKVLRCLLVVIICLLCVRVNCLSQESRIKLFLGGGYSFTGTGDAPGYAFANQFDIRLGKRSFLSPGLQLTNHFQTQYVAGYEFRNLTTGLNLYTNINFFVLNFTKHKIALGAGPVLRLQSTSLPSELAYGVTDRSNIPHLIVENKDPVHTLALGYNVSPSYYYQISRKLTLCARLGLQNDTRGDLVTSEMILLGISL